MLSNPIPVIIFHQLQNIFCNSCRVSRHRRSAGPGVGKQSHVPERGWACVIRDSMSVPQPLTTGTLSFSSEFNLDFSDNWEEWRTMFLIMAKSCLLQVFFVFLQKSSGCKYGFFNYFIIWLRLKYSNICSGASVHKLCSLHDSGAESLDRVCLLMQSSWKGAKLRQILLFANRLVCEQKHFWTWVLLDFLFLYCLQCTSQGGAFYPNEFMCFMVLSIW